MPWVHRTVRLRRTAVRTLTGALAAALLLGTLGAAGAQAAAVADPVAPEPAPAAVEGFAPYLPQVSCDPTVKPGHRRAAQHAAGDVRRPRPRRSPGAATSAPLSEHKEGRAWDWGLSAAVPAEKALAEQFLTWLLAPGPERHGRATTPAGSASCTSSGTAGSGASYRAAEGWRAYSGGESHAGHIHISLAWTGAMKRTSWWTGKAAAVDYGPCRAVAGTPAPVWTAVRAATPCPRARRRRSSLTGTPLLGQGDTGPYVIQLQRLLAVTPGDRLLRPDHRHRAADVPEGARAGGHRHDDAGDLGAPCATRPRRHRPGADHRRPVVAAARRCPSAMQYSVREG